MNFLNDRVDNLAKMIRKKKFVENLVEVNEKTTHRSISKGILATRSAGAF